MGYTTGILLFEDAEELDFAGPWEVFTVARMLRPEDRVVTIAATREPVRAAKGLRVLPDHSFADAPPLDVLLVPGGQGTRREVGKAELIDWLRKAGASCSWV
ncbi:MAG TPA: DJ-1/PfpI family protein, partial [Myxococcota bacterium]|nr:DJ-1/PfpI family protein [Myxococcota bacterium]